jgi:hypothetical protein
MHRSRVRLRALSRALLACAAVSGLLAGHALAATNQVSIFEDDPNIMSNPAATLARLRLIGAQQIRVPLRWQLIAPGANSHRRPAHFNAVNPAAYPAHNWSTWDNIVRAAKDAGIAVNFDVMGGAPLWATGPGAPGSKQFHQWEPSAGEFGQFVHAVATRYSGSYDPKLKRVARGNPDDLPAVTSWSVWNEPDYGPSLAPQGLPGNLTVDHAPEMYRGLLAAAWNALHETGHGHDTILFGEVAPRGSNYWGVFSGMKPLLFLRSLYCVDSRYRQLRGNAARERGCPTTAGGSRRFRGANPALFAAGGFADHPYMRWYQPNREAQPDPDYSTLGEIGNLERALDRVQSVYGSHTRLPIYDTEFGYITSPPKHDNQLEPGNQRFPWISQTTAAIYLNWAEYLHWRDPRLKSFTQFLLYDPLPALKSNDWGGFASGLINYGPRQVPKPTYYAWRLPLFLPVTSTKAGHSLEVWGCVRPAPFASADSGQPQTAQIQFAPGSSSTFTTVQTVTLSAGGSCYFDVPVTFPGSGTVRLIWQYPPLDPMLGDFGPVQNRTVYSRHVQVTVR